MGTAARRTSGAQADVEARPSYDEIFEMDEDGGLHSAGTSASSASSARRRSRGPIALIAGLVALALVVGAVWMFFGDSIRARIAGPEDYDGTGNGVAAEVVIRDGDTGENVADSLLSAQVIKSRLAFLQAAYARKPEPVFMPGTYSLQQQMSAANALEALMDENNRITGKVVIPEGTAEQDVYAIIAENTDIPIEELMAQATNPSKYGLPPEAKSLEGFLFPATYEVPPGTTAEQIVREMVNRTFKSLGENGVAAADRWDVIRLASLIQREAGLAEDYPKVSRVFLNRIDQNMPLQSDATVAYGTGNTHRVTTTDAERGDASNPYNTYQHAGMVVRPISNPGDLAIDAAQNPAQGKWLYFVTWNLDTGETIFSETFEEHERAVAKWQDWMSKHPEYEN